MKISSYLKALTIAPQKAITRLSHWENFENMSPKEQGDMSGLIIPKTGSNSYDQSNKTSVQYLEKIYDCHDLVHNCIDLVSSTFALGEIRVKQRNNDGKYSYKPDHQLQKLLDNPNSSMTGFDLKQSYVVHRLLFGTVYILLLRGEMEIGANKPLDCPECIQSENTQCTHILWHFNEGTVTQILTVHPDTIEKKIYEINGVKKQYFVYNPGKNENKSVIHPNNIIVDPIYNPLIDANGSSPTAKVKRWLEIDLGLSKQVGAYFANNAIPSFLLNLRPSTSVAGYDKDPSDILKMLKESWMKKFSAGGDGVRSGSQIRSPAFTYGELEILKIQDTLKDIVIKPLFYEIQNRIAMAYKVPRGMFEFGLDYGSQSATAKQQREDFYNDAIAPQLKSFESKIKRYVIPSFQDNNLEIEWDLSQMGAASFLEEKKRANVIDDWTFGLETRDETRLLLGKDPMGGELGDDLYRISVMSDGKGNPQENDINDNRYKSKK